LKPAQRARAAVLGGMAAITAGVWTLAGYSWGLIVAGTLGIVIGLLLMDVGGAS